MSEQPNQRPYKSAFSGNPKASYFNRHDNTILAASIPRERLLPLFQQLGALTQQAEGKQEAKSS